MIMERKQSTNTPKGSERKPYEKPMIVYRQPLEARATVCTGTGAKSDSSCTIAFS